MLVKIDWSVFLKKKKKRKSCVCNLKSIEFTIYLLMLYFINDYFNPFYVNSPISDYPVLIMVFSLFSFLIAMRFVVIHIIWIWFIPRLWFLVFKRGSRSTEKLLRGSSVWSCCFHMKKYALLRIVLPLDPRLFSPLTKQQIYENDLYPAP